LSLLTPVALITGPQKVEQQAGCGGWSL
jgi:hypothetical protein